MFERSEDGIFLLSDDLEEPDEAEADEEWLEDEEEEEEEYDEDEDDTDRYFPEYDTTKERDDDAIED